MASLRGRLEARGIDLAITDDALDLLAERGYDPVYGARPLKRVLQKDLADPIATAILEGRYGDGDTAKVMVTDGELAFD
jgi:ATP-dependent Clp protease ATP-binding subunit ClpB